MIEGVFRLLLDDWSLSVKGQNLITVSVNVLSDFLPPTIDREKRYLEKAAEGIE